MIGEMILNKVRQCLEELDIRHWINERGCIECLFRGRFGTFYFIVDQPEFKREPPHLLFLAPNYLRIPPDLPRIDDIMDKMAKGLSHINFHLVLGAFGLELKDKFIIFRYAYPLNEGDIDTEALKVSIASLAVDMDIHWVVVNGILWGSLSIEEVSGMYRKDEETKGWHI